MKQPVIINETNEYFVINKPAGMAVEPPSHTSTILDWLVSNGQVVKTAWSTESRFGIVHRLDTDTSGVLLWAKSSTAQEHLKLQWQGRQVKKTYLALVVGEIHEKGEIDIPLSRDNKNDRQQVDFLKNDRSRPALTTYQRLAVGECAGKKVSLVEVHPVTGRTHQIRVHLKAIGHTIIGDKLYGDKNTDRLAKELDIERQMLHAWKLKLPETAEFIAPLPSDLSTVVNRLKIEL